MENSVHQLNHEESNPHSSEPIYSQEQTDDVFIHQTMMTCIGNKRKLVKNIYGILNELCSILSKKKLNIVDGFTGSTVVSRVLSNIADNLYSNDLEYYSYLMAQCYLIKPSCAQQSKIRQYIDNMNQLALSGPYIEGIITKLYAPKKTNDIQRDERCFYTHENALIIDTLRQYITDNIEPELQLYCLVPLLIKASINTNTSGVFKGFHKNGDIGCFGGKSNVALSRIMKPIQLEMPIWNDSPFIPHCTQLNINQLVIDLPDNIDLMYFDPPYNQHPYGSNYFMLNIIAHNQEPTNISKVSGIPTNWNKSDYNSRSTAISSMSELIANSLKKSKYILISYNNEGIITPSNWTNILQQYDTKIYEINYDTYKGSRNLKNRSNKVIEVLYLVKNKGDTTH